MVFAEIITGITLVNKAAEQIKKLVQNANDVSKLAKHIDDMFEGESQINRKRNKRSMFSVHSVAEETINAKLARERLNEMGQLIDLRFGHGTWAGILKERADEVIKAMRSMLINRYHYMRSYMIPASTGGRRLGSARTTAGSSLDAL